MKRAVTLMELIMAIALMGVVILGVASFDVGSRRFLQASERKAKVLNEATLIMDRISKDALVAVGDRNNPAIVPNAAGNGMTIRVGNDVGVVHIVTYTLVGAQIIRSENGVNETLTNRATGFAVGAAINNTVPVTIGLVFQTNQPHATPQDLTANPEVQIQSNIEVPGWSLA
ncbi:MAG: prepilin-type N-terminal cleavage/methylation domain-containing protein [Candidatus Omnitrophica bacterium]|nr:prepilin-type N-terminal cleavage/methylation domain-containing protein [Candidatus Omnitrophota bacterium]